MIDELAASAGLEIRSEKGTFFWRVVVYERREELAAAA